MNEQMRKLYSLRLKSGTSLPAQVIYSSLGVVHREKRPPMMGDVASRVRHTHKEQLVSHDVLTLGKVDHGLQQGV